MNITEKDIRIIVNARQADRQLKKMLIWMVACIAVLLLLSAMELKAMVLIFGLIGAAALYIFMVRHERKMKQAAAEMYEQAKAEGVKVE